ncbi:hypothetical protein cand_033650 [Cryptosporidium andersoni]|uniref:Uncharacterized protein n=1 Tax=Cryptosporidium andersoni TaxID=117008 RepID=A0A1J4MXQ2_9CRYT|nr:hypothetical protein cand_033650 [Cryptosporidium andersoni]
MTQNEFEVEYSSLNSNKYIKSVRSFILQTNLYCLLWQLSLTLVFLISYIILLYWPFRLDIWRSLNHIEEDIKLYNVILDNYTGTDAIVTFIGICNEDLNNLNKLEIPTSKRYKIKGKDPDLDITWPINVKLATHNTSLVNTCQEFNIPNTRNQLSQYIRHNYTLYDYLLLISWNKCNETSIYIYSLKIAIICISDLEDYKIFYEAYKEVLSIWFEDFTYINTNLPVVSGFQFDIWNVFESDIQNFSVLLNLNSDTTFIEYTKRLETIIDIKLKRNLKFQDIFTDKLLDKDLNNTNKNYTLISLSDINNIEQELELWIKNGIYDIGTYNPPHIINLIIYNPSNYSIYFTSKNSSIYSSSISINSNTIITIDNYSKNSNNTIMNIKNNTKVFNEFIHHIRDWIYPYRGDGNHARTSFGMKSYPILYYITDYEWYIMPDWEISGLKLRQIRLYLTKSTKYIQLIYKILSNDWLIRIPCYYKDLLIRINLIFRSILISNQNSIYSKLHMSKILFQDSSEAFNDKNIIFSTSFALEFKIAIVLPIVLPIILGIVGNIFKISKIINNKN